MSRLTCQRVWKDYLVAIIHICCKNSTLLKTFLWSTSEEHTWSAMKSNRSFAIVVFKLPRWMNSKFCTYLNNYTAVNVLVMQAGHPPIKAASQVINFILTPLRKQFVWPEKFCIYHLSTSSFVRLWSKVVLVVSSLKDMVENCIITPLWE